MSNQIEVNTDLVLRRGLAEIAKMFIGVKEVGGNNKGEFVKMFQKAVDGRANGEPWCAAFTSYCIKTTSEVFKKAIGSSSPAFETQLKISESVCNFWFNSPESCRIEKPEVGCLILWRRWSNGKPTWQGHIGIVVEVVDKDLVRTVEGNTSSDGPNERDGDGVFLKNRSITRHYGSLRPLGFLRAF